MIAQHLPGLLLGALSLVAVGCRGASPDGGASPAGSGSAAPAGASADAKVALNGAGATFPFPLYSKWMSRYNELHPSILINYQSIGSGGGIRQIAARTVDFGASDAPMTPDEEAKAPAKLVHLPMTLGAVAVAVNVPGVTSLRLGPAELAGMYLGTITRWNDPKLAAINPGTTLPDQPVVVAYRSDGSGTTAVFTEYLGKISPEWKEKGGVGKSVKFPVGLGAKGNEGVTGQVKTSAGSIGYVELAYALQNGLTMASLRNSAGNFVAPSVESVSVAAASVTLPDSLTVSLTDPPGPAAYPIASYSYVLVYEDSVDAAKGKVLAEFFRWALHEGQGLAGALHYAPLPESVVKQTEARLLTLKGAGQPLLGG
ncbi:MAG: phosphate ABC transporter substrate-binding protein PstS [Deltaproteobacteria bacterium]|nr:phosphate ABC transporter substrate-binding protein PstS [Deltaproteobacteria bacterium]